MLNVRREMCAHKGVLPVCVSTPTSMLEALWRRRRRRRRRVGPGEEDLLMGVDDQRRAMVVVAHRGKSSPQWAPVWARVERGVQC